MNKKMCDLINAKKVILMDFDGTVADTEPLNYLTWVKCMNDYGLEFNEDYFKKIIGKSLTEIASTLEEIYQSKFSKQDFLNGLPKFIETFKELEQKNDVKIFDYVYDILNNFENTPKYIVSNQSKEIINSVLSKHGIDKKFVKIISCMEEKTNKEKIYENAQQIFNVKPCECLLCEDMDKYIEMGKKFGMATIGVQHKYNKKIVADYVINMNDGLEREN